MMKHKRNAGFSAVEALLVFVVIGILGLIGWLVYERIYKTPASVSTTKQSPAIPSPQPPTDKYANWKSYTSDNGEYSLKYPPTWRWVDSTEGPASPVLSSQSNTVLYVYSDNGGKGGDCTPAQGDVVFHKGNVCPTVEYLTSEKLPVDNLYAMSESSATLPDGSAQFKPVQVSVDLVTWHYDEGNGVPVYGIGLTTLHTPDYSTELNKPYMGAFAPISFLTVYDSKGQGHQYIYLYTASTSASFLTSADAATVKDILRTFKLNV